MTDTTALPDLERMLQRWDDFYRANLSGELRKRRHAMTRGEALRLKRRLFRERLERKRRRP